ncbi:MAG: hypothetical protein ABW217_21425 [Polyangiaceae bacterium]
MTRAPTANESADRARGGARFYVVYLWGIAGIVFMLVEALLRLAPMAWEPIASGELSPLQWLVYASWVVFNGYCEGYRGFQRSFSPRAAARANLVARRGGTLDVLLAPLFCMSLFRASRRGLTVAWLLLTGIVLLVLLVKSLPQPWRGIVDGGVVVGLAWGLGSLCLSAARTLVRGPGAVDLQLGSDAPAWRGEPDPLRQ